MRRCCNAPSPLGLEYTCNKNNNDNTDRDHCVASQLVALSIFIFGLACVGVFYPYNRGGLYTALIVLYALTAGIAGYTAGSYYKQMEGAAWVRNILLTSVVFCGPLFLMFCVNNTVAIIYRVSPSSSWNALWHPENGVSCGSVMCCFA